MNCRFCNSPAEEIFLDLGMSPLANSNLKSSELNNVESFYPLCSYFCSKCYLVQLDEFEQPENIFSNYDYYSSFSDTWNKHIESFVHSTISRFNISQENLKISKSNYLPSITILGSKSQEDTDKLTNRNGSDATIKDVNPMTQSIKIEQTIVDLGRNADVQKNRIGIDLASIKLLKKEQDILLKAIEAYTGLILANDKLKINRSNLNLLERQVETNKARLERGQITLSDLAQSEASFAEAQANFIQSKNEIVSSKLNYENIIGPISNINTLEKRSNIAFILPKNLNNAILEHNYLSSTEKLINYNQEYFDNNLYEMDIIKIKRLSKKNGILFIKDIREKSVK